MRKEGQSLQIRVAKWLGAQVAARAVQLVLGTAVVTGAVMSGLAWLQELPLATAFLAVVLASAGSVVCLNQARAFIVAYSVAHKLPRIAVKAATGELAADGSTGYSVSVHFQNLADVPLEYTFARIALSLDERVARQSQGKDNGILPPGLTGFHMFGVVPMDWRPNAHINGELEFTMRHGRIGKLDHERTEKLTVCITTDNVGSVCDLRIYAA